MYGVRVMNNSDIFDAMEKVQKDGHTINAYIIAALRKQLIADGYLSSEPEQKEDG